jgi:hypothetical protein
MLTSYTDRLDVSREQKGLIMKIYIWSALVGIVFYGLVFTLLACKRWWLARRSKIDL